MNSDELLKMKLEDVSDVLLDKLDESDCENPKKCEVKLPGCRDNERFVLIVSLVRVGDYE